MKENIKKILFNTGIILILFVFVNILISSILFFFKISISDVNAIISFFSTIIIFAIYKLLKKNSYKEILISIILFIIILFMSIFISTKSYDLSWDGNSYHKTAVGQLKNGWNPVYETIENFNISDKNFQKVNGTHDIWNNHYAKGAWIFSANIYSLTENIESGKSINLILMFASLFIVISYLLKKFNSMIATIISLLITLNPVSISQIFTFYNDGLIYNYIIILIVLLLTLIEDKENKNIYYLLIIVLLSSLINVKFTGFAYGGITTLFFYMYIIFNKRIRKEKLKKLTIVGIISIIIGVGLIGYSTYIKNYLTNNHPFYPLFGENKVDIMTTNQPKEFKDMNRFKKFIYANFSEGYNITYFQNDKVTLKIPFTFTQNELVSLTICDLRIGGFGVIFGGILLISVIVIIIGMYFMYFKDNKKFYKLLTILLMLLSLVIVLEEAWWARYLPQLYIVPFIALYLLYYFQNKKINKILFSIITILLTINIYFFIQYNVYPKYEYFKTINKQLSIDTKGTVYVYTDSFNGAVYNLYDNNLKIKIIKNNDKYENKNYKKSLIYNDMLTIYQENKKE